MNKWLYPETVDAIERACMLFLDGELSKEKLQTILYEAEDKIVAYEESWLRSLLCNTENRIEEITYMQPEERHFTLISVAVRELLSNMQHGKQK